MRSNFGSPYIVSGRTEQGTRSQGELTSAKLENSVGSVISVAEVTEVAEVTVGSVTSATEVTEPTEFSNFADGEVPEVESAQPMASSGEEGMEGATESGNKIRSAGYKKTFLKGTGVECLEKLRKFASG